MLKSSKMIHGMLLLDLVYQNELPLHCEAHQSCSKIELICDPLPSLHALRNVMLVKDELLE